MTKTSFSVIPVPLYKSSRPLKSNGFSEKFLNLLDKRPKILDFGALIELFYCAVA